jgi:hypothetical protein
MRYSPLLLAFRCFASRLTSKRPRCLLWLSESIFSPGSVAKMAVFLPSMVPMEPSHLSRNVRPSSAAPSGSCDDADASYLQLTGRSRCSSWFGGSGILMEANEDSQLSLSAYRYADPECRYLAASHPSVTDRVNPGFLPTHANSSPRTCGIENPPSRSPRFERAADRSSSRYATRSITLPSRWILPSIAIIAGPSTMRRCCSNRLGHTTTWATPMNIAPFALGAFAVENQAVAWRELAE